MIKSPVSVTLNTSTYAAVTLGASAAYGFTVHAVNSSGEILPFYFATDSAGSDGALCPSIGMGWPEYYNARETVMYAKAYGEASTLVLRPGKFVQK